MSTVRPDLDLAELERPSVGSSRKPPKRRVFLWLVPALVLLGFAWLAQDVLRAAFEEPLPVRFVRPETLTANLPSEGGILVQAAGWVEPDPFPIRVAALTDGVVARVLVQEGDAVEGGDVVAELVFEDARLDEREATADFERALGARDEARAELEIARASFEAAIEKREAVASARARLEAAAASWEESRHAEAEAHAEKTIQERELDTQRWLVEREAAGPWRIELAQAALERACARIARARADVERRSAEREAARAFLQRAQEELETRFEERLRIQKAETLLARREAELAAALVTEERASLRRARTQVRAPANGVVLTRDALPGSTVGPAGTPVCTLYDPASLRIRVDVPQGRIEGLGVGGAARITCDSRREKPYDGKILRLVEEADIQKVTLEVQVRVLEPDERLKPEMLCQVAFLAPPSTNERERATAVTIPARCLVDSDHVFVVDGRTGRAAKRRLKLGPRRGDSQIVLEGVDLADEVLLPHPELEDGSPIAITEEQNP